MHQGSPLLVLAGLEDLVNLRDRERHLGLGFALRGLNRVDRVDRAELLILGLLEDHAQDDDALPDRGRGGAVGGSRFDEGLDVVWLDLVDRLAGYLAQVGQELAHGRLVGSQGAFLLVDLLGLQEALEELLGARDADGLAGDQFAGLLGVLDQGAGDQAVVALGLKGDPFELDHDLLGHGLVRRAGRDALIATVRPLELGEPIVRLRLLVDPSQEASDYDQKL